MTQESENERLLQAVTWLGLGRVLRERFKTVQTLRFSLEEVQDQEEPRCGGQVQRAARSGGGALFVGRAGSGIPGAGNFPGHGPGLVRRVCSEQLPRDLRPSLCVLYLNKM